MISREKKSSNYGLKQLEHVMMAALLNLHQSPSGFVEHSVLYSLLRPELSFVGNRKSSFFKQGLRKLEQRGWIESTIIHEQQPSILIFKPTPRSKVLFEFISEK